jgi:transposase
LNPKFTKVFALFQSSRKGGSVLVWGLLLSHLAEIAKTIAPGVPAALLVDQAGWHTSTRLIVPPNITVIALPPKSPELNPVENIWHA